MAQGACDLCGRPDEGTSLVFIHMHDPGGKLVVLNIRFCLPCGDRVEKHLKRAIPKRFMATTRVLEPPQPL